MKIDLTLQGAIAALVALKIRTVEAESMGRRDTKWRLAFDELQAAVYTAIAHEVAGGTPPAAITQRLQH